MIEDAKWIRTQEMPEGACVDFYTEFELEGAVKSAKLTITAVGMYIAFINGQRVGRELYAPGFTQFEKRIQYQTYDVTELLRENGKEQKGSEKEKPDAEQLRANGQEDAPEKHNRKLELSVLCSEGWAVGNFGYDFLRNSFSDHVSTKFSLDIVYEDGSEQMLLSDESVKARTSVVTCSGVYSGDTIDYTADIKELGRVSLDEVSTELVPQQGVPVMEQERIAPKALFTTPAGERVIDFGQNLSGYVELHIQGKRGDRIVLSHGEVLDKDGNLYTDNLRRARQQATYVLPDDDEHMLKQLFSWQGFRFVRLDEFPEQCEIKLSDFRAVVVHSQMERIGDFVCGNEKINQLYHNIVWGQKSNYIDVPTDCPQRDERLGWTGDAQVFVRTAAVNYDVEQFFKKWLRDLALGQGTSGEVYGVAPMVKLDNKTYVSAAWGDAAVICPWEIYLAYGDAQILEQQFDSMCSWVDYMHSAGEEEYLWLGGKHYGDWLAMDNPDDGYMGITSHDYIASAYFAYSTSLLIKAGHILGRDMTEYEVLYEKVVKAFRERYLADGIPNIKTQTAYALALYFRLCTDVEKTAAGLAEMVAENGMRLTTGFVGTPYLLHALSENGYTDIAYNLLFQEKSPSWLFSVNQGATTMWEHWDGIREDGSFWSRDMNSFNHYAYGAVYDWIFGVAAGVKVLEDGAGYRHIRIEPHVDERMGFLKASVNTRIGKLEVAWHIESSVKKSSLCIENNCTENNCTENNCTENNLEKEDAGQVRLEIHIPAECIAEIVLPDGRRETLTGSRSTDYVYYWRREPLCGLSAVPANPYPGIRKTTVIG